MVCFPLVLFSQENLQQLVFDQNNPFEIRSLMTQKNGISPLPGYQPFFSALVDSGLYHHAPGRISHDTLFFILADSINGWALKEKDSVPGLKYRVYLQNKGRGAHRIENIVPLGEGNDKVYITAGGSKEWPQYLCRSRLYRPGYGPVGVLLPDNAWHLGFSDLRVAGNLSITALARRGRRDKENTESNRWAVTLKPGGWTEYNLYFDTHSGDWHEGLRMMFRQRWLYDLPTFDNSMFTRYDLAWMRNAYIMLLQFAWDKKYYDHRQEKYTFYNNLSEYDTMTGGIDIFTLWPTWPRLGLDARNQWDMYRDLPGGLGELRNQVDFTHRAGKRYFISYNPWDEATRQEEQLKGMKELLRASGADGVVLDTRGESSRELQAAADRVKPGIIMYSEGMAVPKDMPGIVSGRVHDALVMPPLLKLCKYIKPDFAIFRVLQLADDRIHRELAISFFNGYGVEINTMRTGRPAWIAQEFQYLGRTTRILRENTSVFHNDLYFPLVTTLADSVYINRWESGGKILFTIYSAIPKGHEGPLFETDRIASDYHVVDLWNHREVWPEVKSGKMLIPVSIDPFSPGWLNTRREGNVGCVAILPKLLVINAGGDSLSVHSARGDTIVVTDEDPTFLSPGRSLPVEGNKMALKDLVPGRRGKVVGRLFQKRELADELIIMPETDWKSTRLNSSH